MYNISDKLKKYQMSPYRNVQGKFIVNEKDTYDKTKIVKFTLNDDLIADECFTIGTVISNKFTAELFIKDEELLIYKDDLIEPYITMNISPTETEEVPLGKFYVTDVVRDKNKITITALDKLGIISGMYESKLEYPNTTHNIIDEICNELQITYDLSIIPMEIKKPIQGYSYRDIIGIIASLNGASAKMDRAGNLVFVRPTSKSIDIPKSCYFLPLELSSEEYKVTGLCCYFGDGGVGISRGDNKANILPFHNQYVTEDNIDKIWELVKGLSYTTTNNLSYIGFLDIEAGDMIHIVDTNNNEHNILVTSHELVYNGGLTGTIKSVGESKNVNNYKQNKFANKRSLTELNIKLGSIDANILEVETEVIPSTVTSALESVTREYQTYVGLTKDSIMSEVSETYITNNELNELSEKVSSQVNQNTKDILFNFTKETNEIRDGLDEFKQTVTSQIKFNEDGLELGKTDSAFKAKLDTEKLAFTEDDEEIAYISNKKLYITDAEVTNSLRIGHFVIKPRNNGNTSLIWIDE